MQNATSLHTLNNVNTVVVAPADTKTLDHIVLLNRNSGHVYLRISRSAEVGGGSAVLYDIIAVGAGFSGTIPCGMSVHASAVVTATTDVPGTLAPTIDVEASFHWKSSRI